MIKILFETHHLYYLPNFEPIINELKILLANKTTEMLHGKDAAKNSEQAAKEAFSGNTLGSNIPKVKIQSNKIDIKTINMIRITYEFL